MILKGYTAKDTCRSSNSWLPILQKLGPTYLFVVEVFRVRLVRVVHG